MSSYWLTREVLGGGGLIYLCGLFAALALIFWITPHAPLRVTLSILVITVAVLWPLHKIKPSAPEIVAADAMKARRELAGKRFAELCKSAGAIVSQRVDGVESVLLKNFPVYQSQEENSNERRDWLGAPFPSDAFGPAVIMQFVYFHSVPVRDHELHGLTTRRAGPAYRFVEVEERGEFSRYSLRPQQTHLPSSNPVVAFGTRSTVDRPKSTYAVTYVPLENETDRSLWIAGAKIEVSDLRSNKVLGTFTKYSHDPGLGSISGGRQPWALAQQCPGPSPMHTGSGSIRFFVEGVLVPPRSE